MERNIIATIEFKDYQVAINVLEQLDDNNIQIFYSSDKINNINLFMKNSLNKISNIIKAPLKNVFIVIEPSLKNVINMEVVTNKIKVTEKYINQNHIKNLVSMINEQHQRDNYKIVMINPFQFISEGWEKRVYKYLPSNVSNDYLLIKSIITFIKFEQYTFIKNITKINNLNIIKFFTTVQTISNLYLSKNALNNGALLLHFETKKILITYNKNGITKVYYHLHNWGFQRLINNIVKNFNCTQEEAYDLILVYGSLKKPSNESIIYTQYKQIKEIQCTNFKLYKIISNYFTDVLIFVKKYIKQQNWNHLPIVISGKAVKIDYLLGFFQNFLTKSITLYSPIEYLETNTQNVNALGILKIKNNWNYLLTSKNLNTNLFKELSKENKKNGNILNRIVSRLGAKYDWNI